MGTFGEVCSARHRETGLIVALKKIRMDNEKEGFPITAVREIVLLSRLEHPNVVKLVEICTAPPQPGNAYKGSVFLVLEYLDHDLAGIADKPGVRLHPSQIKCVAQQVLRGLAYCHERGVLHRDLKASNVLLDNFGAVKLADFGLARRTRSAAHNLAWTHRVVTLWYRPPELLMGASAYGCEVDNWSVGCIIGELCLGRPLFPGADEVHQAELIFAVCGSPTEAEWPGCTRLPLFDQLGRPIGGRPPLPRRQGWPP